MLKIDWQYIDVWSKKIRAINLLGGKCIKCGNENIFHLCFHHKNNDKDFKINNIKNKRWSIIKEEIKKCELLCNNCHQELHFSQTDGDVGFRKTKQIYLDYKGQKCENCEYNKNPSSLSFHHRNPEQKLFRISKYPYRINNINDLNEYIIEELDKCDILCMNCHVEKHIDVKKFNKFKKEIYYKVDNFKEKQSKIPRDEVKKMYESGIKQVDIAKHFRAAKSTISLIIKEINW